MPDRGSAHLVLAALVGLLALLTGCPDANRGIAPQSAREAMQRIEENYQRIAGPLQCDATVSFSFVDDDGAKRRFIGHPSTIIFNAPRCLYIDVKSAIGGSVARIGSNDDRYWLWFDANDTRKLFWGTWQALDEGRARKLPLPPDQLLDVLMLRALPDCVGAGLRPLLRFEGAEQRLLFVQVDDDGWPTLQREVRLDPNPPYLPLRITDRDAAGRIVMNADISDYRIVEGAGKTPYLIARRFVIDWPLGDATLRIDLGRVRLRTTPLTGVCDFPTGWKGEIEPLDGPPPIETDENH